jgi:hypothetical protein
VAALLHFFDQGIVSVWFKDMSAADERGYALDPIGAFCLSLQKSRG